MSTRPLSYGFHCDAASAEAFLVKFDETGDFGTLKPCLSYPSLNHGSCEIVSFNKEMRNLYRIVAAGNQWDVQSIVERC